MRVESGLLDSLQEHMPQPQIQYPLGIRQPLDYLMPLWVTDLPLEVWPPSMPW